MKIPPSANKTRVTKVPSSMAQANSACCSFNYYYNSPFHTCLRNSINLFLNGPSQTLQWLIKSIQVPHGFTHLVCNYKFKTLVFVIGLNLHLVSLASLFIQDFENKFLDFWLCNCDYVLQNLKRSET